VLLTDHAYGAVRIAAERWAGAAGARVVTVPVPLRAGDDEVTDTVLAAVTARTRFAIIDHVTSSTARRLPLVSLVPALKERSVAVLVDGAHAPGMLAVELDRLGADYWTGNLHKWCCAPRGTAVLHVAPQHRAGVRPLVASWREYDGFPGAFNVTGTDDLTAWLAAPRALRLLDQLGFDKLRRHNVELAVAGQHLVAQALNVERADLPRDPAVSMQLVPLPAGVARDELEAAALQARIGEQIAVEVAVTHWNGQGFVRLSAQAYNAPADYARFAADLPALL
jgi:isopenicillin-N epimerase